MLSGVPTESGLFTPRFAVTDSLARSDELQISLTILAEGPSADIDGDGDVDFADLLLLLGGWGDCPVPPADCDADLSGNGSVGFEDLLILPGAWS